MRCCSLYLAHLERTHLAPILEGQLAPVLPSTAAAAKMSGGPAAAAAAGGAVAATVSSPTVVFLSGGIAAAVGPAAVLSLPGTSGTTGASSGSKGILTELARAADSMVTAQLPTSAGTAQAASERATPQHAGDREARRRPKHSGGEGGGSPTGDLLLLPAGMAPAASPSVVAAGSSPSLGATPRRQQAPAASPAAPRPTGLSYSQQQAQQQPLGCSRLAMHAGSVLLRLVDDFLLITAVPAVAHSFATRMLEGRCSSCMVKVCLLIDRCSTHSTSRVD